jgi:hypothetical protein
MTDIQDTLRERQKTHGSFAENARISQGIKSYLKENGHHRTLVQREALDLIATKLGRIGSGNANEADHWRDIAGYAMLVVKDIERLDTIAKAEPGEIVPC